MAYQGQKEIQALEEAVAKLTERVEALEAPKLAAKKAPAKAPEIPAS